MVLGAGRYWGPLVADRGAGGTRQGRAGYGTTQWQLSCDGTAAAVAGVAWELRGFLLLTTDVGWCLTSVGSRAGVMHYYKDGQRVWGWGCACTCMHVRIVRRAACQGVILSSAATPRGRRQAASTPMRSWVRGQPPCTTQAAGAVCTRIDGTLMRVEGVQMSCTRCPVSGCVRACG